VHARPGPGPNPTRSSTSADVRAALDALRRIVQALRLDGRGEAPGSRPSSAQLFALRQLAEHPGASINELAALTFTHQSSVSVVVQRLVARGLVARLSVGGDRRRHRFAPSAAGRRLLRNAPPAAQDRLIAAISALPARERRVLVRSLGRAGPVVGSEARGAPPADVLRGRRPCASPPPIPIALTSERVSCGGGSWTQIPKGSANDARRLHHPRASRADGGPVRKGFEPWPGCL